MRIVVCWHHLFYLHEFVIRIVISTFFVWCSPSFALYVGDCGIQGRYGYVDATPQLSAHVLSMACLTVLYADCPNVGHHRGHMLFREEVDAGSPAYSSPLPLNLKGQRLLIILVKVRQS